MTGENKFSNDVEKNILDELKNIRSEIKNDARKSALSKKDIEEMLNQLTDDFNKQINSMKQELTDNFNRQINSMLNQLKDNFNSQIELIREEIKSIKTRLDNIEMKTRDTEELLARIREGQEVFRKAKLFYRGFLHRKGNGYNTLKEEYWDGPNF